MIIINKHYQFGYFKFTMAFLTIYKYYLMIFLKAFITMTFFILAFSETLHNYMHLGNLLSRQDDYNENNFSLIGFVVPGPGVFAICCVLKIVKIRG